MILVARRFSLDPAFRDNDLSTDDDKPIDDMLINPKLVLRHAIALMDGHEEEALKSINKALEIDPNFATAWYKKGEILIRLKRSDEALECFNKVINMDTSPSIKANSLIMLGKIDEALSYVYLMNPSDPYVSEIVELLGTKIESKPENAAIWNKFGSAFYKVGKYNEALNAYNRSLEINSICSSTWFNRGVVLSKLGNNKEALQSYEEAIRLNPLQANAWYNKGAVLVTLGNYTEAIKCFDEAIRLKPQYSGAWNKKVTLSMI